MRNGYFHKQRDPIVLWRTFETNFESVNTGHLGLYLEITNVTLFMVFI